jgi:hypothetical protein
MIDYWMNLIAFLTRASVLKPVLPQQKRGLLQPARHTIGMGAHANKEVKHCQTQGTVSRMRARL